MDHLLQIRIEGPPLEQWDATTAVNLWQREKIRRVSGNHTGPRKKKAATRHSDGEDDDAEFCWSPSDWEKLLDSDSSNNNSDCEVKVIMTNTCS